MQPPVAVMADALTKSEILAYRRRLWRLGRAPKLKTEAQAQAFVEAVGLCLLFECEEIPLPKLCDAAHDDADWWSWKDTLQAKRKLYNARLIARKATLVSMELLPSCLAVYCSEGGCEEYEEEEHYGRISADAVRILRRLDRHGPVAVDRLRLQLFPRSPRGTQAFHKALTELQTKFKTAVVGLEDRHWGVRVIDLFTKWIPAGVRARARRLLPEEARDVLALQLLTTAGALTRRDLMRMLRWDRDDVAACVTRLLTRQAVLEKPLRKTAEPLLTVL